MARGITAATLARQERRQKVTALYLKGESQVAIAAALQVTQGTISNDLAAIRKQWVASTVKDFGERQAMELARLDHLEAEAWAAYERSCVKAVPVDCEDGDSTITLYAVDPSRRPGDPRFLERVAKCIELRCKITGVIGADTNIVPIVNVDISAVIAEATKKTRTTSELLLEMARGQGQQQQPLPIGLKELPTKQTPTDAELLEQVRRLEAAIKNGHTNGESKP